MNLPLFLWVEVKSCVGRRTGHHPRTRFSLETPPYIPLPPPVSPLIYGKKGGLNRGDNAVNKIFPENFQKLTFTPIL
jgi:hypothetical protein